MFLRRSGKSPENRGGISTEAKTNTRESRSPESIVKDNSGNSRGTFSFVHNLELDGMHLDGFPFEIRAYEGLLATVIGAHKNEYETVAIESGPFFDILDSDPESSPSSYLGSYSDQARLLTLSQHQKLRRLKERITAILSRIKFTSTMIRELLEDKQLPFLCLTDMSQPLYNKYK